MIIKKPWKKNQDLRKLLIMIIKKHWEKNHKQKKILTMINQKKMIKLKILLKIMII